MGYRPGRVHRINKRGGYATPGSIRRLARLPVTLHRFRPEMAIVCVLAQAESLLQIIGADFPTGAYNTVLVFGV